MELLTKEMHGRDADEGNRDEGERAGKRWLGDSQGSVSGDSDESACDRVWEQTYKGWQAFEGWGGHKELKGDKQSHRIA